MPREWLKHPAWFRKDSHAWIVRHDRGGRNWCHNCIKPFNAEWRPWDIWNPEKQILCEPHYGVLPRKYKVALSSQFYASFLRIFLICIFNRDNLLVFLSILSKLQSVPGFPRACVLPSNYAKIQEKAAFPNLKQLNRYSEQQKLPWARLRWVP